MHARLSETLEAFCVEHESLSQLIRYQAAHDQLLHVKSALREYVGLQERVTTALDHLDKAKDTLEANDRDRSLLRALEVIPVKGPLSQLRQSLRLVTAMECMSDRSKEAQSGKATALQQAITELETFAASAEQKVATVSTHAQLREVRSVLAKQSGLFAETDEACHVDNAIARCDVLDRFFGELALLRMDKFTGRLERQQITTELDELAEQHKDALGPSQQGVILAARERVASHVTHLEAEAAKWLAEMEAEVHRTSNLKRLAEQLSHPPEFLTEEGSTRLLLVEAQLTDRREEDRRREEARREEERNREEARREEESVLRTLAAISPQSPLVRLREGLELVQGIVSPSPRVLAEQAKKRAMLESAKAELEGFAVGLGSRLDSVTGNADLGSLRTAIDKKESFFCESQEMLHIEKARTRCEAIADLLKDIAAIRASVLDTPSACQACFDRLATMKESYAGRVSQGQMSLITTAEDSVRARLQDQEQKAGQWLIEARKRFTQGCDLSRMLDTLNSPPAFLPTARQSEFEALRADVRIAQEKDLCGQVRILFGRISDKASREQLVEELRVMLCS